MYARIERKRLAFALECAKRAAGKANGVPLDGAEIDCDERGAITVRATDLHVDATIALAGERCDGPYRPTVANAAQLHKIVAKMRGDDVEIDTSDQWVEIRAGKTVYKIVTDVRGNEFPERIKLPEHEIAMELDATELSNALGFALAASLQDGARPHLCGVLFDCNESIVAGTDGHRLHCAPLVMDDAHPALIELAGARFVAWLLGKLDGASVTLVASSDLAYEPVAFRIEGYAGKNGAAFFVRCDVRCRCVSAEFPPYEKVTPRYDAGCALSCPIEGAAIVQAIGDVALVATDGGNVPCRLCFDPRETSGLSVRGDSPGVGEASADVEIRYFSDCPADGVTIGVNGRYVTEFYNALPKGTRDAAEILLRGGGLSDAIRLDIDGYVAVIMPMRL